MLEIEGKYNTAIVYNDTIEQEAVSQLYAMMNYEHFKGLKIRMMSDVHSGKGCCIGTTMTIKDKVVPALVGVDISCGVLTVRLKETHIDLPNLDSVIHKYIPSGRNTYEEPVVSFDKWDNIIADIDLAKAKRSIGTLGGGNHFIEVDKDEEGNLYLVVHTGSRHLGLEVCDYYQKKAYEELKAKSAGGNIKELRKELIKSLTEQGRTKEISKQLKKLNDDFKKHSITEVPYLLAYCEGQTFDDYVNDMNILTEFASLNRRTIVNRILKYAGLHEVESFDTVHNYLDTKNMILRKGAISAQLGEKVIIPMNMRDGSLICVGKGNPNWNYSAPHGAGRLMSRSKAKSSISMQDFKDSMSGIYSTSVSKDTIDESPMVYKPMEEIISCIKDTVEIVDIIKPIYNFKAGEEK